MFGVSKQNNLVRLIVKLIGMNIAVLSLAGILRFWKMCLSPRWAGLSYALKHLCQVYFSDLISVFHSWRFVNSLWHLLNEQWKSLLINVGHWLGATIVRTLTAYCKSQIYSISVFFCIYINNEAFKERSILRCLDTSPTAASALVHRAVH